MEEAIKSNQGNGLFSELKNALNTVIDNLESEQSKVNKAMFEALTQDQRNTFCQSLKNQNVKTSRIERITGKSQSTVNRHLNNK
ncbi:TPA: hypothetical protein QB122_002107 [Pasteurella multocida]|nr:hypothetical protein [Pasteurella multocida]HDR0884253.1 hypothetical protein [Pasteurella multocida]HDR0888484.1 hypothetical protein [Pasteurella multocida]HDR0909059.1 hypothetical protein [Pasteurella multocida]HDR0934647.1 hypothetical protein [Pasteurella multocida]